MSKPQSLKRRQAHAALLEVLQLSSKACLAWRAYDNERSTSSLVTMRRTNEELASALQFYNECSQLTDKE